MNLRNVSPHVGKGEFGEVLLAKAKAAEDEEETVVLVKSLQTRDEQMQLDFRRECDMFAKLSHANVARLLGICREVEPHYIIMEYTDMVTSAHCTVCLSIYLYTVGKIIF